MTEPIRVEIPGPPVAQGRGRAGAVYRRGPDGPEPVMAGKRVVTRVHDPEKSRNWKATAQEHCRRAMDEAAREPIQGPVMLFLEAVFPLPVSQWRKRKPRPRSWHMGSKDLDNVTKAACDAGNGVLWLDDRQVALAIPTKVVGAQGEPPVVRLEVWELEGMPTLTVVEAACAFLGRVMLFPVDVGAVACEQWAQPTG